MHVERPIRSNMAASRPPVGAADERAVRDALATAHFVEEQRPDGSAFMIGEAGLTTVLHQAGDTMTDREPDYVVLEHHEAGRRRENVLEPSGQALCRTRTDDPFLTMEVLYQLS
jgi:ribonucleotide monophosphatase NagD (HAD superfamily)